MNTITTITEITIDTKPVRNKNAKPVYCISEPAVYASGIDAAIKENIVASAISNACRYGRKANGKLWCFVEDMPKRVLDICNVGQDLYNDANAYRAQEAERKAKEAHIAEMKKRKEEIEKKEQARRELDEQIAKDKQMYEAMAKEFDV